jgi:hypothetical protein
VLSSTIATIEPTNFNSRSVSLLLNLYSVTVDRVRFYGLFDFLPELYREENAYSCLRLATTAVARAYESNLRNGFDAPSNRRTLNAYSKALQSTSTAISNDVECNKDSTLMAIWLLSIHEVSAERNVF